MRTTLALALGALLAFSGAAFAQPGGFGKKKDFGPKESSGGGVEAELKKLREQIRDLEAKVKGADAKKSDKKDFSRANEPEKKGPGGFGKFDPEQMKKFAERFKEAKKGEGKEAAKGKEKDGKKGPPWARGGEGERKGPPPAAKGGDRKGPPAGREGGERKMGPGGFGPGGFGRPGFGPGGPGGRGPGAPAARSESRRLDDLESKVDEILRILRGQRTGGPAGRGR